MNHLSACNSFAFSIQSIFLIIRKEKNWFYFWVKECSKFTNVNLSKLKPFRRKQLSGFTSKCLNDIKRTNRKNLISIHPSIRRRKKKAGYIFAVWYIFAADFDDIWLIDAKVLTINVMWQNKVIACQNYPLFRISLHFYIIFQVSNEYKQSTSDALHRFRNVQGKIIV